MEKDKSAEVKNGNSKCFIEDSEEEMARIWTSGGRRYYSRRADALAARRSGDRIYYSSTRRAYYIIRPQKRSFWGF